jgi:phosphoribosylaminoimidazolecarboxamide formyltransferase/IMP cyclohydrolase
MRALISVYDKSGLVELANRLVGLGIELVASGGTSKALSDAGLSHLSVEDLTGFPEMFDGRVKTLHPKIHGAILADRSRPQHMADLEALGSAPIDIVVSNLYPFHSNPSIELIDIGGPTLVRGAAKNSDAVTILVDPADYDTVIDELAAHGHTTLATRRRLAGKAFAHTAAYDTAVAEWFGAGQGTPSETMTLTLSKIRALKYGENPHQSGALYDADRSSIWRRAAFLSGPEPSYLNIFDATAAWQLAHEISDAPTVAIIKHANPSGVAFDPDPRIAYRRAFECDPISAFGGIIAFNVPIDESVAEEILAHPRSDVLLAPSLTPGALAMLSERRKNCRIITLPAPGVLGPQLRSVGDAYLVQNADEVESIREETSVTARGLSASERQDLQMAWTVCARTGSNAIVIVHDGAAIGVGCGQQSRVDSAKLAVQKAGEGARGAVAASDAFFPFPDGLEVLVEAGVVAVVAPSGSIRDGEIAARAEALGISYVFAGRRHFRH